MSFSPNISERLWNKAYDKLKQKEPKLVDAYESILSRELKRDDPGPEAPQLENSIAQTDTHKRWSQMEWLVQAGLKKTKGESRVKQTVGEAMQGPAEPCVATERTGQVFNLLYQFSYQFLHVRHLLQTKLLKKEGKYQVMVASV
jgi:hypothetical protein